MNTLHWMILKIFGIIFLITLLFFILILELVDIFANIWHYMDNEVSLGDILLVVVYYLPKCISYAVPISMLFAISFTMGTLYANNELIAIFNSGISLLKLVTPFLVLGLIASIGVFFFEDQIVMETVKAKRELEQVLLKRQTATYNRSNFSFRNEETRTVYKVDFYDDANQTMKGILLVQKDENKNFKLSIKAVKAEWNGEHWVLHNCQLYSWNQTGDLIVVKNQLQYDATDMQQEPKTFRESGAEIAEMSFITAADWIEDLKKAGLPYVKALTDFYNKFSYALRTLIVVILASSIGGAFKKNILLMSLLSSLIASVIFFVFQMVTNTMAQNGFLPPFAGAFVPFFVFVIIGFILFKRTRT
ncbi:MAG: LptF/LptG family permease [Spirochaetales bacterium]|nr:LptF/LptG family permease [Spirochaetales bacterium]